MIRTFLTALTSPLLLWFLLMAGAIGLLFTRRFEAWGKRSVLVFFVAGWVFGTTPVADLLVRTVEGCYTVAQPPVATDSAPWIVVLAAGAIWDPRLPPGGWMTGTSLYRVVEGVRLQQAMPESQLVFMGGTPRSARGALQEPYRTLALQLGADPERTRETQGAWNTEAEARLASEVVPRDAPLFLVTTESHLRRAVFLFRSEGLDPIPAPAQSFMLQSPDRPDRRYSVGSFFPSIGAYRTVERVAHEHVGLLWAWLRR